MSYLLDNAIRNTFEQCKATDSEKVIFELKTIYNEQADTIVFFIRDDAGGMSEQQYNAYRSEGIIETTKQNGTGEGIPTILEYFKAMGCKDVELLNFPYDGIMYTATFSVKD
jgi:sensor histidine kinase regulating citrate/malate metabolism